MGAMRGTIRQWRARCRAAVLVVGLGLSSLTAPAAGGGAEAQAARAGDGDVQGFDAVFAGDTTGIDLAAPVVDLASTPSGGGYWSATADGGVFAFGDARFHGSMGGTPLDRPVVAVAATPTGGGYWLAAADGGVFAFGDARFHGSMGGTRLDAAIVDMAPSPTGDGYVLVAADGGVFAFGDARFHGSMGGTRLRRPVVGVAATASGDGYWLAADDGGVFAFGDAAFRGGLGGIDLAAGIVAIAAAPDGAGYWLAGADGGVFAFGSARHRGSARPVVGEPVVALAGDGAGGYWTAGRGLPSRVAPPDGFTSAQRVLSPVGRIDGAIAPKSVVHSGGDLFLANNMMYRHSMTVYDRDLRLVATIPDSVVLSDFGITGAEPGRTYQGAPVEAAFTSDGRHAYVSNYRMYGPGYGGRPGHDGCDRGRWDESFLYRVSMDRLAVDQVIPVGAVPKFVAVTPDDRLAMVTNWCGFDLSVIDTAAGREVARVDLGRHPRGIAVTSDSRTAYVAVMGSRDVAVVDLTDPAAPPGWLRGVGANPRHLVLSPDDRTLYATLNGEGRVARIDLASGRVTARVATGNAPRTMVLSDDGTALYVVNYRSNTFSKVRTADMVEVSEHRTGARPIGITYDPLTRRVWVSNYSGSIQVFQDAAPG